MNIKKVGAAVLLGALVVGCGKNAVTEESAKEEVKTGPVLSVNGEVLTREAINADIEAMLKAQGDKVPAEQQDYFRQMVQNQIAQSFIIEKVLVAKAKAAGFTVTDADRKAREAEILKSVAKMPDAPKSMDEYFKKFPLGEARARAEFENGLLVDKMIKDEQAKAKPATDFETRAKEIIEKAKAENAKAATSEQDALKKIKDLQAQLAKVSADKVAEKFAELAKANSACPSSAKGGDLGEFTHGQMVKEFDEVAFKLPVNKVSEPVKTQFGYHLILTTKKVPAVEAKGAKPAEPVNPVSHWRVCQRAGRYSLSWGSAVGTTRQSIPCALIHWRRAATRSIICCFIVFGFVSFLGLFHWGRGGTALCARGAAHRRGRARCPACCRGLLVNRVAQRPPSALVI